MKFVTLALAVFLAVGCQAASLQADAPAAVSPLDHARAVVDLYVTQIKDTVTKALDLLDGTEYAKYKTEIISKLDNVHANAKALQQQVQPVTDSVVTTLAEATADLRNSIQADWEALKLDLEPMRANLRDVVNRHVEQYRAELEPIMTEYQEKHRQDMDALKVKLEPVMKQLRTKIETNVEETKVALEPIIASVRAKIAERVETTRAMVAPYVDESKDHIIAFYNQAQQIDVANAQEKLNKLLEEARKIMGQ